MFVMSLGQPLITLSCRSVPVPFSVSSSRDGFVNIKISLTPVWVRTLRDFTL